MKKGRAGAGSILPGAKLGRGSRVSAGAIVGYKPSRQVAFPRLEIGPGAVVRSGTVVYLGSKVGRDFETGHNVVVREENEIGDGVWIWSNSVVDYGCRIGSGARIHSNVYVAQYSVIEEGAFIGPGALLLNDLHPGCAFSRQCMKGPRIGRNAVVGGGAVILPMIEIGAGALIGAGAVVTRNVPAGAVVYGRGAARHGSTAALKCRTGHVQKPYPVTRRVKGKGA